MSRLKEALEILAQTNIENPMQPAKFAEHFWPGHPMHRQVVNTGNGATAGKKAWLCGGSYLAKLTKKKLVYNWVYRGSRYGYYITQAGRDKLKELQGCQE